MVRFYHGFPTAIFIPVARATIAEYFPSKRGERISTFTSATIVGRGIAPFLGGFILAITVWNFHLLYLAVDLAGVTTLFLTYTLLREKNITAEKDKASPLQEKRKSLSIMSGWRAVLDSSNIMITSTRFVWG